MITTKKVIKVLAKKSKGMDRKAKVQNMLYGLSALCLMSVRQRRMGNYFVDNAVIDKVENILKQAERNR